MMQNILCQQLHDQNMAQSAVVTSTHMGEEALKLLPSLCHHLYVRSKGRESLWDTIQERIWEKCRKDWTACVRSEGGTVGEWDL